jgi:restriction system protein
MPTFNCEKHSKKMIERLENHKITPYCSSCLIEKMYDEKHQNYLKNKKYNDREYKRGKRKFLLFEISKCIALGMWNSLLTINVFTFFQFWKISIWISVGLSIILLLFLAKKGRLSYGHNAYSEPTIEMIEEELKKQVISDAVELVRYKIELESEYYYKSVGMDKIDTMDGFEFEEYVGELLLNLDYINVEVTKKTGDGGVDILAIDQQGNKVAVQCKRLNSKVGNSAIQEIYLGKKLHNCSRAVVITNSYFTKPSIEASVKSNVELWDRDRLIEEIQKVGIKVSWDDYLLEHYNIPKQVPMKYINLA